MKEVILKSGRTLKIHLPEFDIANNLYQCVLAELKDIQISSETEQFVLYKELFTHGFSSKNLQKCVWDCFKFCTYDSGAGDLRIDKQTFASVESREDYIQICYEVCQETLAPFLKNLYVLYQEALGSAQPSSQA